MNFYNRAKDLYDMMNEGKLNEAFEKHYAENCVICEKPTGEIREGKEAQRQAIEGWNKMVKEFHGNGYTNITSNEAEKTTMVESWTDVTFQDGNRIKMEEVAVQKWNDEGQIEHEQFYYQMGPPPSFEQ